MAPLLVVMLRCMSHPLQLDECFKQEQVRCTVQHSVIYSVNGFVRGSNPQNSFFCRNRKIRSTAFSIISFG